MSHLTCADVFRAPGVQTPVITRFSTVIHERGSPETLRDPRGFAVKFYTREGNWDLVGNNMPVFFIRDGIKFPDMIHALKPNPKNHIQEWWRITDFFSHVPESMHMVSSHPLLLAPQNRHQLSGAVACCRKLTGPCSPFFACFAWYRALFSRLVAYCFFSHAYFAVNMLANVVAVCCWASAKSMCILLLPVLLTTLCQAVLYMLHNATMHAANKDLALVLSCPLLSHHYVLSHSQPAFLLCSSPSCKMTSVCH